ncbi:ankyrin repeat domain-containing protein [Pseudomonas sp.]|uniref:ankyrin repeat domain-containing protein n=1 Tax=Pseudomonas sp. TaxID=306 RepID=UPI003A982025
MTNPEEIYEKNIKTLSAIHADIASGNGASLKKHLEKNPALLHLPLYGLEGQETLLHMAAEQGQTEICRLLVALGIALDQPAASSGNSPPLAAAAGNGHLQTCQWFLEAGALVDGWPDSITTPLIDAITSGHQHIVNLLIEHHADINRLHTRLNTAPLDIANTWGFTDIAAVLRKAGAVSIMDVIENPAEEFGGPIATFVHNTAGWVLPAQLSPFSNEAGLELRISCIEGKNKFKLLFTVGLFAKSPHTELFVCLPGDWPLTQQGFPPHSPWVFPVELLSLLARHTFDNGPLSEGQIISKTDKDFAQLSWPSDADALLVVDKIWNTTEEPVDEHHEDSVKLYVLVPLKLPKKGLPEGDALASLLEKKRKAGWKSIALTSPLQS